MTSEETLKRMLFPHERIRDIQSDLAASVKKAVGNGSHLVVHAPTGLGKTAAALSPALSHAIRNDMTVFFLTSRHTQHAIVIETLKKIKERYSKDIIVADMIGRRWMCPVPEADSLYSSEFSEFCKSQREDNACEFCNNTIEGNKFTLKAKELISDMRELSPMDANSIITHCSGGRFCPYEITMGLAKKARVVIGDYYYIFNESIMNRFFGRSGKKLEKSIIIIDEGHNLPERIRELMTGRLTTFMLTRAIKEAKKFRYHDTLASLRMINDVLNELAEGLRNGEEKKVTKEAFLEAVRKHQEYDDLSMDLEFIGDEVRKQQKQSYIGSISHFLSQWTGEDNGFTRLITRKEIAGRPSVQLSYRCLDPALISSNIIEESHSTILMSGTLNPTYMYKDILGFPDNTEELSFKSPFPITNRLSMVLPKTTTKFTARNETQYKEIARICAEITGIVPGNSAIFFPSYLLRDRVNSYFNTMTQKPIFLESSGMAKNDKEDLLERFKAAKDAGAVLLGAAAGSFGEGIDLPGDLLKCVIIVGLPLQKPDLETSELIAYYDRKFGKGWDYGYLFPAFNKSLQNAGRCIRSRKDKGVIVFLDERYAWPQYSRCFPADSGTKISHLYQERIEKFFRTISPS